jgi:hypothetical protein
MSRLNWFGAALAGLVLVVVDAGSAQATSDCRFSTHRRTMTLQGSCVTDATLSVPDGITLSGRDFTITAVDPPGGHFVGAVLRNAGAEASVRNLRIATRDLRDACDIDDDRLVGIALTGASGSIAGNTILSLNEGGTRSGCQEGVAIQVRNLGSRSVDVDVEDNVINAYQKVGIQISGDVRANVRRNAVIGFGPVDFIAQNGIELASGADAVVTDNLVRGNAYTGTQGVVSIGILVIGGPHPDCGPSPCALTIGTRIARNVVLENDVGIYLQNTADLVGAPALTPTRVSVTDNVLAKAALTNITAQIGIVDVGNRDRITDNVIAGPGYDPAANPGAFTDRILADAPFTVTPTVRRNHFFP